jgi:hypothetical protein
MLVACVSMRGGGKDEVGWQGFWSRLHGEKGLNHQGHTNELSRRLHQHQESSRLHEKMSEASEEKYLELGGGFHGVRSRRL